MLVFGGVHRLNNAWIWMNMIVSQVSAFCRFAAKELPERNGGRGFLISDLAKFILYFRVWPTWKTDENRGMWRCKVSKDDDFSRRRTRVVECPSGIDVSGVNALSVAEFLSTVTQQQTGWRDLKVSWSIHHSRFNCEGYRDVERAWRHISRSCLMPQCINVLALPKHVPPIFKGIWTWHDKEHELAQASK